jgi:hypothetical protein
MGGPESKPAPRFPFDSVRSARGGLPYVPATRQALASLLAPKAPEAGAAVAEWCSVNLERQANMDKLILALAIAMVVPFPIEEIVGFYVRLLMVPIGFTLIIWWIIQNDQKNNQSRRSGKA